MQSASAQKQKKETRKEKKEEVLPCHDCASGGCGSCHSGRTPAVMCNVALQVTGCIWIEKVIARKCEGPEYMQTLLMQDFLENGPLTATPPDI